MATLAELTYDPANWPTVADGLEVGDDLGLDDMRIVVRIAVPITSPEHAEWGTATWNTSLWSEGSGIWGLSTWGESAWSAGLEWLDVTDRLRGCAWTRGGDPLEGRPPVGTAAVDLDNHDGYLSPWNPDSLFPSRRYLLPGATVQIWWWAGAARPAFTGRLFSSEEQASENTDADLWVTWQLEETTRFLADINRLALTTPAPAENGAVRVDRLTSDAGWPYEVLYGSDPAGAAGHGQVQATVMAQARLTELYLTGDSLGADVYAGLRGELEVIPKADYAVLAYSGPLGSLAVGDLDGYVFLADDLTLRVMPWANPPRISTSPENITNTWTIARTGGSEASSSDLASQAVVGEHGLSRNDLIHSDEAWSQLLADYLVALTGPAARATKFSTVTIDPMMDPELMAELITQLDIHRSLYLYRSTPRQAAIGAGVWLCAISGYTVNVVAVDEGRATVTADLTLSVLSEVT